MDRESLIGYLKELLPDPVRESEGLDGSLTLAMEGSVSALILIASWFVRGCGSTWKR
jgi:hypothetical protein